MALNSGIQTYQILTNDDEVCIPSLSSILLAVLNCLYSESDVEMDSRMESRITCTSQMVHLCPGYTVGCALCAVFMPETCMVVCPFVGLYCGKFLFKDG